jgi:hypothetical protein
MGATNPFEAGAFAGATTTVRLATDAVAGYIAGFVAAEGTFVCSGEPPTFTFAVGLGATDTESCVVLAKFFGVGHVHTYSRRQPHYDDETTFAVRALRDHLDVIIPFMDEHLPESHKRRQYLTWRAKLLDYWEHRAKRRRPCTVDGCAALQRAHGLCRHHLYEQYGY